MLAEKTINTQRAEFFHARATEPCRAEADNTGEGARTDASPRDSDEDFAAVLVPEALGESVEGQEKKLRRRSELI
jgi:hypothetical protein